MAEGLLNAFWRGLLSQTANATTELNTNENEVCRRLILSGITVSAAGVINIPGLTIGTITVPGGGTGVVTLTNHGVVLGQGVSPVVVTAAGTTGQVLTGVTGADPVFAAPATNGTVTSVALTVPAEFSVAGSPVTTTGTLAVTKATQAANLVFAGPTSGGAVAPTFRAAVVADLPVVDVPHGGTGVATLAAHGVVLGNGAGVVAVTAAGTTGQILTGVTGADPVFATAGVLDRQLTLQTVANTVTETAVYTFAVPGGTLGTTRGLRLSLIGDHLINNGSADSCQIKVKYGATTIANGTVAVINNGANRGGVQLTCELQAMAATNVQRAKCLFQVGDSTQSNAVGVLGSVSSANTYTMYGVHNSVAEDSTASKNLVVTFQMGTANALIDMRAFTVVTELI